MVAKKTFLFACVMLYGVWVNSAPYRIIGHFSKDTIKVGEPVWFSLTASYPVDSVVVFPDSAFDFAPFELARKYVQPTLRRDSTLFDSTAYELLTFELNRSQSLKLPVYFLSKGDSIPSFTEMDTVILKRIVSQLPDKIVLKENTSFQPIPTQKNQVLPFAISLGALVLIALLGFLFWKPIGKKLRANAMKKAHERYLLALNNLQEDLPQAKQSADFLALWKDYLQKVDGRPIASMTTRELSGLFNSQPEVVEALKELDLVVYAGQSSTTLKQKLGALKDFSISTYENKRKEVQHG